MSHEELENLLCELNKTLSIPKSRRKKAKEAYRGLGNWLGRQESAISTGNPRIYVQGSFRHGTAIKPFGETEEYDLDLVCQLNYSKQSLTQEELMSLVGEEIKGYAKYKGMQDPDEGARCWTLHYADEARFHMDVLPALEDGENQYWRGSDYFDTAIAITDREKPNYKIITDDWPHSNPKGLGRWFVERMGEIFHTRRQQLALKKKIKVEKIPTHRVQTPLQATVRILKHHRDQMFAQDPKKKPISVIITTLAAHCYKQQDTILATLHAALDNLEEFIENRYGVVWIPNPTDPEENFADNWKTDHECEDAFYDWLNTAQRDFKSLESMQHGDADKPYLRKIAGNKVVDVMFPGELIDRHSPKSLTHVPRQALNVGHKKDPPWVINISGEVKIWEATYEIKGSRPKVFFSDGPDLPKGASLIFKARTNIKRPYKIFWQVVNTGEEATRAGGLRGGFDQGNLKKTLRGRRRDERTLYRGSHTIECFVVKNGWLVAKSGPFIVNIE